MQQILLSSQNLAPNPAKTSSAGNHSAGAPLSATNHPSASPDNTVVNGVEQPVTQVAQGDRHSFTSILTGLKLPQENQTIQRFSADDWENLLNHNPALKEQLANHPEIVEKITAFIEGQGLSSEGEKLPLLMTGGDESLHLNVETDNLAFTINNLDLNTSEAFASLKQMISGFLSEQEELDVGDASALNLSVESEGGYVLGGEFANISVPYNLAAQSDTNTKAWGRLFEGEQSTTFSTNSGRPSVNTAGVVSSEFLSLQDRTGNTFNMQQGVHTTILQSESDVQFKATFDSFSALDGEVGDLLEVGRSLDRADSTKSQFSEIQSKLQGGGLKQYSTSLETNVQDPEWGDQMGQKIVWLTGRAIQSAEIHLNPADLGPIEVQIKVQNEQAAVTFHAQNNTVRDMLESNVHRLREMMESNGVDLAEVTVGSEDSGGQYSANDGNENEAGGSAGSGSENDLLAEGADEQVQESNVSNRIVDFYA